MNDKKEIAVSILDAKDKNVFLLNLKDFCNKYDFENYFNIAIHMDVMDNKFVNNTGIDLNNIKIVKKYGFYVDTHLMVENPIEDEYVKKSIEYGTDSLTIHFEIKDFENEIIKIKKICDENNVKLGVAINPDTKVESLVKYKDYFNKILVMSVYPGLGGQRFIENTILKLEEARKVFKDKLIQVDGGIKFENFNKVCKTNLNSIVIGSYLTKAENLETNLLALK